MSGLLVTLLLAVASFALLWVLRLRGRMLGLAAIALGFGTIAGIFFREDRPDTAPIASKRPPPALLTAERHGLFGTFTAAERWLILADSYTRTGETLGAAQTLQAAVREHPKDVELWVGYGNALVDHAGALSPASRFAFYRAIERAPDSPAPRFFLALAMQRSGDRNGARTEFRRILEQAPPTASWRPLVERRLAQAD